MSEAGEPRPHERAPTHTEFTRFVLGILPGAETTAQEHELHPAFLEQLDRMTVSKKWHTLFRKHRAAIVEDTNYLSEILFNAGRVHGFYSNEEIEHDPRLAEKMIGQYLLDGVRALQKPVLQLFDPEKNCDSESTETVIATMLEGLLQRTDGSSSDTIVAPFNWKEEGVRAWLALGRAYLLGDIVNEEIREKRRLAIDTGDLESDFRHAALDLIARVHISPKWRALHGLTMNSHEDPSLRFVHMHEFAHFIQLMGMDIIYTIRGTEMFQDGRATTNTEVNVRQFEADLHGALACGAPGFILQQSDK